MSFFNIITKNSLLLFILYVIYANGVVGQEKKYSFNNPGNVCYFKYTVFAPNNSYNSSKRPFIFVLGKEGESTQETFANDTLKNMPEFHNYSFVYIPNNGRSTNEKLSCIEALVSSTTYGFKYGHQNLFLIVKDTNVKEIDIKVNDLKQVFNNVQLEESHIKNKNEYVEKVSITEKFKETFIEEEQDDDTFATYYEGETKKEHNKVITKKVAKKVYLGAPSNFDYTLTGRIIDASNGEVLPFTNIVVEGTSIGATSNIDGYFTILKVPTDTNTLVVKYVGYNVEKIYLTPKISKINLKIKLSPASEMLKGVNVFGERQDFVLANKDDVSMIKMTPKKIAQLPSIGEKDIIRSFQLMPGVSASNESSSGLYVRGGTPDQNLVTYDGFTVYHVDHLYGFFSAFNSHALKDVQLYKGGFESKFGGRLSSVTEITGKEGNQKKII